VAGVVEPDDRRRAAVRRAHDLPPAHAFADIDAFLAAPRFCRTVFVCTPDHAHYRICKAVARAGYDVLLEKPVAHNIAETLALLEIEHATETRIVVAHVLRYTPFFTKVRELVQGGALGRVLHVKLTECIGQWHFAHSYVRGNWRRTDTSGPIILTKSSHDLDILAWLLDAEATWVSSEGSLVYFNEAHAPVGATERCVACPHRETCLYSATRFYLNDRHEWPYNVIAPIDDTPAARAHALETGPYGRCVYHNDNDVCDTEITWIRFASGATANFSLQAHTAENTRRITIWCEGGAISGDLRENALTVTRLGPGIDSTAERLDLGAPVDSHGGGDIRMLHALHDYFAHGIQTDQISSLDRSVASHLLAFLAEESRRSGGVRIPMVRARPTSS